jgi:hypothetical protein
VYGGSRKKGDRYVEVQAEKYATAVHNTYVLSQNINEGATAGLTGGRFNIKVFDEVDARVALKSLDIINEFQTVERPKIKGGWNSLSKPTSFTKNARHRLLEAGAIVDKFCGLNAYEITCTLPGSTRESMRLLAENTGWIMNELTQIIRRAKCKYWFYVWEYQKRGALHLHMLVADPVQSMENLAVKLQSRWWGLLKLLSSRTGRDAFGRKTGGSWSKAPIRWQSHIAPIQKSVAAYFSKYAGKGSSPFLKSGTANQPFCPSRWWGCSTEIKDQIKVGRQRYTLTTSSSTSHKIKAYLHSMLQDADMIRRYDYSFDLGKTANGTVLGCGDVCVRYYNDAGFTRMQRWEKIIWDGVLAIAQEAGEYDDPTQTWTDADMACLHPLYADMDKRPYLSIPPLNQPSSHSRKLSKARGTQPTATLALRARLLQYLSSGGDGLPTGTDPLPGIQLKLPLKGYDL